MDKFDVEIDRRRSCSPRVEYSILTITMDEYRDLVLQFEKDTKEHQQNIIWLQAVYEQKRKAQYEQLMQIYERLRELYRAHCFRRQDVGRSSLMYQRVIPSSPQASNNSQIINQMLTMKDEHNYVQFSSPSMKDQMQDKNKHIPVGKRSYISKAKQFLLCSYF